MGSIKITDLGPHSGELSDNDQFVIVDTSDTDGPNSSTSGKTTRLSAEKIKTSLQGEKGERGDPGLQGNLTYIFLRRKYGCINNYHSVIVVKWQSKKSHLVMQPKWFLMENQFRRLY